jgi:hypothetical protein
MGKPTNMTTVTQQSKATKPDLASSIQGIPIQDQKLKRYVLELASVPLPFAFAPPFL